MLIFHLYGDSGAACSQLIVTVFGVFDDLVNIINCANFHNDHSRGFRSSGT
jgi:hypothetical protein